MESNDLIGYKEKDSKNTRYQITSKIVIWQDFISRHSSPNEYDQLELSWARKPMNNPDPKRIYSVQEA